MSLHNRRLNLERLEDRLVLDGSVAINEIMYYPQGNDFNLEWVEITNLMSVDVELSGWSLTGAVDYVFAEGTKLVKGQYLVVAASPTALQTATGFVGALGGWTGRLDNGGDTVELRDRNLRLIDELTYSDDGDWPVGPDGAGPSLAKIDHDGGTERFDNWTTGPINGTPGVENHLGSLTTLLSIDAVWKYEQSNSPQPVDWNTPGFNDNSWSTGAALLFSESAALPAPKNTPLTLGATTYYFRTTFQFTGSPSATTLSLRHVIDDGAVIYLNGAEVLRPNMNPGPVSHGTFAASSVGDASFVGPVEIPSNDLLQGTNTLAVEVHQGSSTSSDIVMGLELSTAEVVVTGGDLVMNEVSSTIDALFQIELANRSDVAFDLTGFEVVGSGSAAHQHVLAAQSIPADGYVTLSESQLGFRPGVGDKLFFYTPGRGSLVDAVVVQDRLRGRRADVGDRWQFPSQSTFGSANSFIVEPDIVINEIMFHHQGVTETSSIQPQFDFVSFADIWRYRQTGPLSGDAWKQVGFNDTLWPEGDGLFFAETSPLPGPKNTPLAIGPTTYYFRTTFEFNGDPSATELLLNTIIDDGAVFYLNGTEIHRQNMPDGTITASTFATDTVTDADLVGPIAFDTQSMVMGTNVLAVELHQASNASFDAVFGARIFAEEQFIKGTPFQESLEEWIELYNRSATAVDLGGWGITDAVEYTLAPGTILAAGEYLVVSNNLTELQSKFPGASIGGSFSGKLSNKNDRIQLVDQNRNLADEVEYFDKGRWPLMADGRGSSIELKDPWSDNSKAEAWAASDETEKSIWQTITYTEVAQASVFQPSFRFNELLVGLLDEGKVLIDNISIVESPQGTATELIQNGTFESGTADKWRLLGTHDKSVVIVDPDDPANHVLQLVASAPKFYLGNRAETTLAGNVPIVVGREYQVSFRAKWLTGSPRLHTELHYNRLVRTTNLAVPQDNGTSGAENSRFEINIGPTYSDFRHGPVVPNANEPVTVSVQAEDADGIAAMTLWYAVNEGTWINVAMTDQGGNQYAGTIPGQGTSALVQFYVEGTDGLGAMSTFPANGRSSRALYRVQDGAASLGQVDNIRILMTASDVELLHRPTNVISNDRIGGTIIYNESEFFYDVGVRLKGSIVTRGKFPSLVGFNIRFDPDHLFRGAVEKIGVKTNGRDEILVDHIIGHAGGIPARYEDFVHYIRPSGVGNGRAILALDPYGNDFLDAQYVNGSDGTVFKMEGISSMLQTTDGNPESLKLPQPLGWQAEVDLQDLGDDKEQYRWLWGNINNHDVDDFSGMIATAKAFGLTGQALEDAVAEVIDVDQFMRVFAFMSLIGANDAYSQGAGGAPHNINFYAPPDGGKMLALQWDWDDNFLNRPFNAPLWGEKNIANVIERPVYNRLFLGHLLDIVTTTSNESYMAPWVAHYSSLAAENFTAHFNFIRDRGNFVLGQLPAQIPFEITTNGGQAFGVADSSVVLEGRGWIDVREVRLLGVAAPLAVKWLDSERWQVAVPLDFGNNTIQLEATDHQGAVVGVDTIAISTTASVQPQRDFLRITELHYHPDDPSAAELAIVPVTTEDDFEFVEIMNTGSQPVDLDGVRFTTGVTFDFTGSAVQSLNPGEFALVVGNQAAFTARYGNGFQVAGEFATGKLSDQGEQLVVIDQFGIAFHDFTYDDVSPWPVAADGDGFSLEVISIAGDYGSASNWHVSALLHGTPATHGLAGDFNFNGIVEQSDYAVWSSSFGSTTNLIANASGNGIIDAADYTIWRDNLGTTQVVAVVSNLSNASEISAALPPKAAHRTAHIVAVARTKEETIPESSLAATAVQLDPVAVSNSNDQRAASREILSPIPASLSSDAAHGEGTRFRNQNCNLATSLNHEVALIEMVHEQATVGRTSSRASRAIDALCGDCRKVTHDAHSDLVDKVWFDFETDVDEAEL